MGMSVMADPTDESNRVSFIPLNLNQHQIRAMGWRWVVENNHRGTNVDAADSTMIRLSHDFSSTLIDHTSTPRRSYIDAALNPHPHNIDPTSTSNRPHIDPTSKEVLPLHGAASKTVPVWTQPVIDNKPSVKWKQHNGILKSIIFIYFFCGKLHTFPLSRKHIKKYKGVARNFQSNAQFSKSILPFCSNHFPRGKYISFLSVWLGNHLSWS